MSGSQLAAIQARKSAMLSIELALFRALIRAELFIASIH
jgi:hypothetical protein